MTKRDTNAYKDFARTNPFERRDQLTQALSPEQADDYLFGTTPQQPGELRLGKFILTEVGLRVEGHFTFDDWEDVGQQLFQMERTMQWLIGDWMVYGEGHSHEWGKAYTRAIETTGYSYSTLRKFAMVSNSIDLFRRRNKLKYSHHIEVAHLAPDEQDYWLDRAEEYDWSVRQLREAIQPQEMPPIVETVEKKLHQHERQYRRMVGQARQSNDITRTEVSRMLKVYIEHLTELERSLWE